jgi:hypothetical protein
MEEAMSEIHDYAEDYDEHGGECWQCGGEGRVAGTCIDGCCFEQDDPDCPYCSHRCDVCNPKKKAPSSPQVTEGPAHD